MQANQVQWLRELPAAGGPPPVDDGRSADLFYTLRWYQHLARCGIEPEEGLYVACVAGADGTPAWMLPLQLRRQARAAVFGRSLASLSNYYSSLFGPVGDPARVTPAGCEAFARALRREVPGSGVVDLQPLDAEAPFTAMLERALDAAGYRTSRYFCFGNWYLPVQGRRWSELEARISSRQRNTVRRARKKLEDAGPYTLQIHQTPGPALDAAIADYEAIYAHSWKQAEPYPEFVPGLCRWTAEQGWLRLGVVRVGDVPVAAQIWFVHQRRALIFKLAYDEGHKRLSAGSVLTTELMRQVVDVDQVEEIDYLTGDDAYKAEWMSHRRERVGLLAFSRTSVPGLAAWARHLLGRWRAQRAAARAAAAPAGAAPEGADAQAAAQAAAQTGAQTGAQVAQS